MNLRRFAHLVIGILLAATLAAAQSLPAPEQYLGFRVGTDRKLATWPQVVNYMQMAARASDRVRFEEIGKSTMGHPFVLMTISSPKNLARLAEIRANQRKLAYPYNLGEEEAAEIIANNPAVILVTLTIHASELGSTQMSLELVHRLATENSPYIQNLLDNVVFLLAPSVNPDGQVMVIDWYNKNVGTEFEYAPMPWLYHKYTGHDDNRDSFMLTQVETRLVTKVLYQDWFPLAFLDEHQMGSSGPRIFVPPFDDPVNPNIDPAVIAGSNLLGMHMFNALNKAGYEGVLYGERFTWWWQGSAKNGAWYHNMLGLLTEVASARVASPVEQQRAPLYQSGRREGGEGPPAAAGDPRRPLAPPNDTWPRTHYPRPWTGGTWRLRDIVDYELVITYALLEAAAVHRAQLQQDFYALNRKAIETGKKGSPFAYVIPAQQHDPGAAAKMLEVLDLTGVEIYRAKAAFEADGKKYDTGSYVVPMAQPFRNYAKDLLEPQNYPMKPPAAGQMPERPYDITGWTLPLQMGVAAVKVDKPFEASLERVSPVPPPQGKLDWIAKSPKSRDVVYLISPAANATARLVNRLWDDAGTAKNAEVVWTTEEFRVGERLFPAGTILVYPRMGANIQMDELAKESGLDVAVTQAPIKVPALRLRPPRIGLYQPWVANMDEGWTRWLLEQYAFPYIPLHNEDVRAGKLVGKYDVVIFASQSKAGILNGQRGAWQRPEYRGGIGEEGSRAIQEFVRAGGTLITLDDASDFAIDELGLPVRNVLRGVPADKFFCPGAILRILVDNKHPLAYGMAEESAAFFLDSPAFELSAPFSESVARAVVKYPATNPLLSGWIGGPEHLYDRVAVAEVSYGKGRVVLFGFRAQFRAQPHATFKLLFNAIQGSAAAKP